MSAALRRSVRLCRVPGLCLGAVLGSAGCSIESQVPDHVPAHSEAALAADWPDLADRRLFAPETGAGQGDPAALAARAEALRRRAAALEGPVLEPSARETLSGSR